MATTPHDGQGTKLSWAPSGGSAAFYTVTNIVYTLGEQNNNVQPLDVSHLGQTTGEAVLTQDRPLVGSTQNGGTTGRTVDVDYQGTSVFTDGVSGTLAITVGGSSWLSGIGTVVSSSVTLATNDIVRGRVQFKIAR